MTTSLTDRTSRMLSHLSRAVTRTPEERGPKVEVNVGSAERAVVGTLGSVMLVSGLQRIVQRRGILLGLLMGGLGGLLAYRGASGHCPMYAAMGVGASDAKPMSHPLNRAIHVSCQVTINRSPQDLYNYWRHFTNLQSFMPSIKSIRTHEDGRSHWVAEGPRGKSIEWNAQLVEDRPNELIAWSTVTPSDMQHHGRVRFMPEPVDRGTIVHLEYDYTPPAGVFGAALAGMMRQAPGQQSGEDLRRFKQLMEAGELPTTADQPRGQCA